MDNLWQLCNYEDKNTYNERFEDRKNLIISTYNQLIQTNQYSNNSDTPIFRIDEWLVCEVVERYFLEVARIKQIHGLQDKISIPKVAGYIANWIVRIRPVQILLPLTEKNNDLRYINEDLALSVGIALFSSFYQMIQLKPNEHHNFKYQLRYRVLHADNLAMVFEAYETILNNIKDSKSTP